MKIEEQFNDSNSLFSASIIAPLEKRQTTGKQNSKSDLRSQQKIQEIGYQIVQQLSIITPLQFNPKSLCEGIQTFKYQRKLPVMMQSQYYKKQIKEKADFITTIVSLFKNCFASQHNKFTIFLPFGGLVYFLYEQTLDSPKIFISLSSKELMDQLINQQIKFRQLPKLLNEKQRLIIENNQIRLFFGFFLNWIINKKVNIDIYANYSFQLSFKDNPIILKTVEKRQQYDHLIYKYQTCIGQKVDKLYIIRYDCMWYMDDVKKIEQQISILESNHNNNNKIKKNMKIDHDYEIKILKYTLDLNQSNLQTSQSRD